VILNLISIVSRREIGSRRTAVQHGAVNAEVPDFTGRVGRFGAVGDTESARRGGVMI